MITLHARSNKLTITLQVKSNSSLESIKAQIAEALVATGHASAQDTIRLALRDGPGLRDLDDELKPDSIVVFAINEEPFDFKEYNS